MWLIHDVMWFRQTMERENLRGVVLKCLFGVKTVILFAMTLPASLANADSAVLRPFKSDGCSLFPDGTIEKRTLWCECCFEHDIAYWQGGTREQRKKADEDLKQCVMQKTGNKALAQTMFLGVRAGGSPAFPTWYRWGYGWNYGRGYKPLGREEKVQISHRLPEVQALRKGYLCN